ncbi:MAG: hypothetical protein KDB22_01360 [Planctomycetales bacterium]|nr:hypothetical protein [Planctomycetales bacterium]
MNRMAVFALMLVALYATSVMSTQVQKSLVVRFLDQEEKPVPGVKLRVYDGPNVLRGKAATFRMETAIADENGVAQLKGFFDRLPEESSYWIEVFQQNDAKWRAPNRLIGRGASLAKSNLQNPLIELNAGTESVEITITLRQECPIDVEIVDAETGDRKHFAQLLFKDNRVRDWTLAALQDYVADPGGEDPGRIGLDFFTTIVPEMNESRFMATREGYFPVEFRLPEKPDPSRTVRHRVELVPAPPIELTIVDESDAPIVGAELHYIGPDVRGSVMRVEPSNQEGKILLKYPELGELAQYRIKHFKGEVDVSAKEWLQARVDTKDTKIIEAVVQLR